MQQLKRYAEKLKKEFPLLTEDIDKIMSEAEEKYQEEGLLEHEIRDYFMQIDELL